MKQLIEKIESSPKKLSFILYRLAKPQPRPILKSNGSRARYPDNFYDYYDFLRAAIKSITISEDYIPLDIRNYPLHLDIVFYFMDMRSSLRFDIDNLVKPIPDALEAAGIISNDNVQYIKSESLDTLTNQAFDGIQITLTQSK